MERSNSHLVYTPNAYTGSWEEGTQYKSPVGEENSIICAIIPDFHGLHQLEADSGAKQSNQTQAIWCEIWTS